jgi:MFS transporter, MHS family, shikimate and dehydroshikimate transport protein
MMSDTRAGLAVDVHVRRSSLWKVAAATIVGSAVESFDFLAYGTAAALVFNKLFFPTFDPVSGTLAAFGTFASGMLARPLGAVIFGHFGDRLGRKSMLTLALLMMGVCTVLIGFLPTYGSIGIWAAVLLVILRIGQGLSYGGELGGAMLMAVEHAPPRWKSLFSTIPQLGAPIGILMSTGTFAIANMLPEGSFLSWGWRVPFVASFVLVGLGVFIRQKVDESPEFANAKLHRKTVQFPVRDVILTHFKGLLLTVGAQLAVAVLIYTVLVFSISFATGHLGFSRMYALRALIIGSVCQIAVFPVFGWLGDRVGPRRLYIFGSLLLAVTAIPLFMALGSGSKNAYTIAIVLLMALNYAILFAPETNLYASQFPPELRYSGVSVGLQIAIALGGGFAPFLGASLVARYSSIVPVGILIAVLGLVAAFCAFLMNPATGEAET